MCVLIYVAFFMGKKKAPTVPMPPAAPTLPAALPGGVPGVPKPMPMDASAPFPVDLAWGRDPFVRPELVKMERLVGQTLPALKLEGILEGQKGRMAIINKDIVERGDTIGNEQVQAIERDRVVLVGNGTKRALLLNESMNGAIPKERPQVVKK